MTSDQQRQFEHIWPALSLRLQHLLTRKKISPWLIEDLVQETGLRLIRMWPQIDQTKPIWPLTATVALNLFRDELRRAGSKESLQTLPDPPSIENVEERGMARIQLRAVGGALAQMSETQRNAILSDLSSEPSAAPLASSARMIRMRARRRLQQLLDHASALGMALGFQMRRAIREIELVISRALPSNAERATAAAISLLAAVSFGVAVAPTSPGQAGEVAGRGTRGIGSAGEAGNGTYLASAAGPSAFRTQRDGSGIDAQREQQESAGAGRVRGDRGEEDIDGGPGPTYYQVMLSDDTYLRGEIEVEVMGTGDPNRAGDYAGAPGSVTCSFAPSHTGASCTASENGSENRGVRAEHRGEAKVAGRRIL